MYICICTCIYIYICTCVSVFVYIYYVLCNSLVKTEKMPAFHNFIIS